MIDYKKYPPNWKTEIVPRILKRANNKCEKCGLINKQDVWRGKIYCRIQNEKGIDKYGYKTFWFASKSDFIRSKKYLSEIRKVRVVLTIAHLDHDETNWEVKDNRLMAMCQMCHLTYDVKEKYRRMLEKSRQKKLDL